MKKKNEKKKKKKKKKHIPELKTQHLEPPSIIVLGVDSGSASGGSVSHIWAHSNGGGCIWMCLDTSHLCPGVGDGGGVIVLSSSFVVVIVVVGGHSHCCW